MSSATKRTLCTLGLLVGTITAQAATPSISSETNGSTPLVIRADSVPHTVTGLARHGHQVYATTLKVKDRSGQVREEARPNIAVLRTVAWSPDDAARDGASEFEILICAARLLDQHGLAGIVGVGNRQGAFLPAAEVAFQRIAHMGMPIVRLAKDSTGSSASSNLFIEGGSLSAEEARQLLAECLLRHGALPPALDPAQPTAQEVAAIKAKLAMYQADFDLHKGTRVALR